MRPYSFLLLLILLLFVDVTLSIDPMRVQVGSQIPAVPSRLFTLEGNAVPFISVDDDVQTVTVITFLRHLA
jgi:hypothetical protein